MSTLEIISTEVLAGETDFVPYNKIYQDLQLFTLFSADLWVGLFSLFLRIDSGV